MFLKSEIRRTAEETSSPAKSNGRAARLGIWQHLSALFSSEVEITEVRLAIRGLPAALAGLRLVQLSDIHMGSWMTLERLNHAVGLALSLRPDAYLLTGDYLPGKDWFPEREAQLADLSAGLAPLAAAAPAFAVLGNHDHRTSPSAIRETLANIGITDLTNGVYPLGKDGAALYLAGVDDINVGYPDLDQVLRLLPADGPAILLTHEPDFADIIASTGRFALHLSGHTHGGQVVLPWVGALLLPKNGRKYPSGLYKVGEMYQYTNRGIGTGRLYTRFNCRPEITQFVLEPAGA